MMNPASLTGNKTIDLLQSLMDPDERAVYMPILHHLLSMGYRPAKQRARAGYAAAYCFKHPAHGKQIAKTAITEEERRVRFSLRFSACESYPPKLADILRKRFEAYGEQYQAALCDTCGYCKGETHVYRYVFPDGQTRTLCGTYTIDLPDLTPGDIPDIQDLIEKQHAYFMHWCQR